MVGWLLPLDAIYIFNSPLFVYNFHQVYGPIRVVIFFAHPPSPGVGKIPGGGAFLSGRRIGELGIFCWWKRVLAGEKSPINLSYIVHISGSKSDSQSKDLS